jgi:NDP-sugar pyrophosphorylase family protein
MVKLKANTNNLVIIPTVGLGSRMGELTAFINKGLVPFKNKPVLAHIIDQFSNDTKFIIPVGYKKEQVIDFCNLAYPERNIEFVEIDNYIENFTGPGYTIKQCIEKITGSFYYIPCDSYFTEKLKPSGTDTYYVKQVDQDLNFHYTTFKLDNNKILDIQFKETTGSDYYAFTGVMYIKDHIKFIERLQACKTPEIIETISVGSNVQLLNSWLDFGNLNIYTSARKEVENYDFTKTDEITYICNNKVLKYWKDSSISQKKYTKYLTNPDVYPEQVTQSNGWLKYDFGKGKTLYQNNKKQSFKKFLDWMDKQVWITKDVDLQADATKFYKEKTLSRIDKFLNMHKNLPTVTHINNVSVKHYDYYLNNIDWNLLTTCLLSGYTHGDLQFDNVLINKDKFTVIDWRHEFGDIVEYGDIYYDLSKLYGGFLIDYSKIKQNNFNVEICDGKVSIDIPYVENYEYYVAELIKYIKAKNYNLQKVKLLIPVIYWNMAPLHKDPFDKLLWYLGIMLFEQLEHEKFL